MGKETMKSNRPSSGISRRFLLSSLAVVPALSAPLFRISAQAQTADPLPSWNDGRAKQSILDFVAAVTREGSPDFVPVLERIATFDNDGTLWVEQPMYTQLAFALDRVKALAPEHPEWRGKQPFKAVLDGDMKALEELGERGMLELVMATHADMTTEEFETEVEAWLATARHPRFNRPYTELVYQPMLEVLAYLRSSVGLSSSCDPGPSRSTVCPNRSWDRACKTKCDRKAMMLMMLSTRVQLHPAGRRTDHGFEP